jgi:MerR family redox-sensitive transcriptional activator SoxR
MPDTDAYGGTGIVTPDDIWLSVGEAAALAGVSVSTLQRWDRNGILRADRTPTNQRRYRRSVLVAAMRPGDTAA